jgi:tRNA 2-thiouridine synthesizing protein C
MTKKLYSPAAMTEREPTSPGAITSFNPQDSDNLGTAPGRHPFSHTEICKKSNEQGLIIFSSAPYGKITAQEGQDLAMAASAFYPELSILFLGDGLLNCLNSQMSVDTLKPFCKTFASFPLYDIQYVYALEQDCHSFGLKAQDFNLPLTLLDHVGLQSLLQSAHWILHY